MQVTVNVEGLRGIEDALAEFAPKLVKKAFKQAMQAAAQPEIDAAKAKAPLLKGPDTKWRKRGDLRDSIGATIKLQRNSVIAKVGPRRIKGEGKQSPGAWGLMEEFGSIHNPAQPYLRPAFEETKQQSVDRFAEVLRASVTTMGTR